MEKCCWDCCKFILFIINFAALVSYNITNINLDLNNSNFFKGQRKNISSIFDWKLNVLFVTSWKHSLAVFLTHFTRVKLLKKYINNFGFYEFTFVFLGISRKMGKEQV